MLDKKRGYNQLRPHYAVDGNVNIMAGMIAFLAANAAGVTVATTAASGTVPIGTFWKDRSASLWRSTVETRTFNAANIVTVTKGNFRRAAAIKVTNAAGTVVYTQGVDYTATLPNGILTRLAGGAIIALQVVIVSYEYAVAVGQEHWDNVSTQWSMGTNYDRQPNDTIGSGRIAVAEGDTHLFTDQYDVAQVYALNSPLRSDALSLWSSAGAGAGMSSVCGRVIKLPTAADPLLGVAQIRVAV